MTKEEKAIALEKRVSNNRVKAALLEAEIDEAQAAQALGCEIKVFRMKCQGHSNWVLNDVLRLSQITGKPLDYFITGEQ